jgi:hypothetical protein
VDSFCQEFNAKMMFAGATKQRKNQAAQQWQCASHTQKYNLACSKSCHWASLRKPTSTRELILGLKVSQHPPVHHPKDLVFWDCFGWDETQP